MTDDNGLPSRHPVANDPGVGSIFNTMYYLGSESVYSDVTSQPGGKKYTDTMHHPVGERSTFPPPSTRP